MVRSRASDSAPSRLLIGSRRKAKPRKTGAAMYCAIALGTMKGDTSIAAPVAIDMMALSDPPDPPNLPDPLDRPDLLDPPDLPDLPDLRGARRIATSSAPSKIAGQIVANDQAYPNRRSAKFSGSPV